MSFISEDINLLSNNSQLLNVKCFDNCDVDGYTIVRWIDDDHYVSADFLVTEKDVPGKDAFVISVAKGQTIELSADLQISHHSSVEHIESVHDEDFSSSSTEEKNNHYDDEGFHENSNYDYYYKMCLEDLNSYFYDSHSINCEFKASTKFVGPEEYSKFNSREFRVRFYENVGKVTVNVHEIDEDGNDKIIDISEGKFTDPSKFIVYSVDKTIA